MNPLRHVDEFVDRNVRRLASHGRIGVVIWVFGNACELTLLAGLIRQLWTRRTWRSALRLVAPFAAERALVHGLGPVIDRDRPGHRFHRPANLGPSSTSLPSGHASNAVLSAALLSDGCRRAMPYALAVGASSSRVTLRVHRFSDAVLSAAMGAMLGRAFDAAARRRSAREHERHASASPPPGGAPSPDLPARGSLATIPLR